MARAAVALPVGGDILVRTTDLEITDKAQRHCSSGKQLVIDVKTGAMVDNTGAWGDRCNATTNQHDILDW